MGKSGLPDICITLLYMGRSKGKAVGIQLKCIPEKRDATEMYPRKVMHIIDG